MADKKISTLTSASTPLDGTEVLPIVQSGATVKVPVSALTAGRAVSVASLTSTGWIGAGVMPVVQFTVANGQYFGWPNTNSYTWGMLKTGNNFYLVKTSTTDFSSVENVLTGAGSTGDLTVNMGNLVIGTAGKGIDFSANSHAAGMTSELLNAYEEGTWTPVFTGLTVVNGTGGATYTGTYTRVGRLVYFTATITVTGSCTTASVNGVTYTSLPFTAVPLAGSAGVADANAAPLNVGLVAGAVCYMPTWSARNVAIYIGGTFSV